MIEYFEYYMPLFLTESWISTVLDQLYLILLIVLFSLITYLFIKNRKEEDSFILNSLEQRAYLRAISTYTHSAIIAIDENERIKFANSRFLKLFQLNSSDVEGKYFSEISLPNNFKKAVETYKNYEIFEIKTDSGKKEKRVIYRHPITTDVGQLIGDLILIGSESGMEKILSDDPQDVKLEKISHSLKTPLNAIMGYSQLLLDNKGLDVEQRKYLHTITENSHELLEQIDELLHEEAKSDKREPIIGLAEKAIEKILIVDDVSFNRTLMRIMLERHGYQLEEAKNGQEALTIIEKDRPDLILMDITMPIMDGVEALKHLRSKKGPESELPVIAVTAQSRKGNKQRLLEEGFDGYLQKPFKEEELMKMIRS